MKKLKIVAGKPIKYQGTDRVELGVIRAGSSRAVPITKFEFFEPLKEKSNDTN